jgi:flagellar biosynthesis/type III secretory pathway protein FliH
MSDTPRILKGGAPLPLRVVPGAVRDADRRAQEIIEAAEAEARAIVRAAHASRKAIAAEARLAGRAEGHADAAALLARAAHARDRLLAGAEREVVAIALAVARKVIGRALGEDAVAELAARALEEARERREVLLRVNPADGPAVRGHEPRLAAILLHGPLELREDPAVPPGAAIVETEAGRVDASLDTQLDLLARALAEASP